MKKTSLTPTVGLEIHVELATNSKMFCGCPADHFAVSPNTQTCPVCLGLPGALPVPNQKAIDWTILIGQALGCKINHHSKFDRKHYFYPDLPKGYQISQYDEPLCETGSVETPLGKVGITRVHLEEDTGKLQHTTLNGKKVSLVDFNRSGVPLVEIVSEPDITSSAQAKEYAKALTAVIRFLGVSDADMEKGSMRLEANISLGLDLGYKVEVKNINSFRYLEKAIDYEFTRQQNILNRGETPKQETRGYNETKGVTFSQRSKEEAQDYRYFPDPDIPPLEFDDQYLNKLYSSMPALPSDFAKAWQKLGSIKQQYLDVLLATPDLAQFADAVFKLAAKAKMDVDKVAGHIVNQKLNPAKTKAADLIAKLEKSASGKISDQSQIKDWVQQAIEANPTAVKDYHQGKQSALSFLMGQIMRLSRGQADPSLTQQLLKKALS